MIRHGQLHASIAMMMIEAQNKPELRYVFLTNDKRNAGREIDNYSNVEPVGLFEWRLTNGAGIVVQTARERAEEAARMMEAHFDRQAMKAFMDTGPEDDHAI